MISMFIRHWTIRKEIKQDDRRDTRILVDEWKNQSSPPSFSARGGVDLREFIRMIHVYGIAHIFIKMKWEG
jgi:hypothetical protein